MPDSTWCTTGQAINVKYVSRNTLSRGNLWRRSWSISRKFRASFRGEFAFWNIQLSPPKALKANIPSRLHLKEATPFPAWTIDFESAAWSMTSCVLVAALGSYVVSDGVQVIVARPCPDKTNALFRQPCHSIWDKLIPFTGPFTGKSRCRSDV